MDSDFLEQIERARGMTGEEKIRESLQLYDRMRRLIMDGLRNENPNASEMEIDHLFFQRLEFNRSLESTE